MTNGSGPLQPPALRNIAAVLLLACTIARGEESSLLQDTPKPNPVVAPSAAQIEAAIQRGCDFLLSSQNPDGSWGSATRTKGLNIYAPIPGAHQAFRAAVTSLSTSALLRAKDRRPEVAYAIHRAKEWLIGNLSRVRRANGDAIYNVWAHAYAIEALADLVEMDPSSVDQADQLRDLIRDQIELLERFESVDSGWGYYDFRVHSRKPASNPTSFTTATVLVALHRAQHVGITIDPDLITRSMQCIRRMQNPDFTYHYSFNGPTSARPVWSINRAGGSLGRSQVCNLALRLWGDPQITDEVLNVWLDRLFARNLWLDMGRKRPIPHESHFLVAGYFFFYGHWYAAQCIEQLPEAQRQAHKDQMARLIVDLQEKDGSWWDYPLYAYHQPYGTAMAVMTLARVASGKWRVASGECE
jgi:hypothetical protein